jgi:hypothetical protein
MSRLARPTKLLALLKDSPKLRIVVVSASHDQVLIYKRQEAEVNRAADLCNIIRGHTVNDQPA